MFISHLKRSHKTGDRAHDYQPVINHRVKRNTFESQPRSVFHASWKIVLCRLAMAVARNSSSPRPLSAVFLAAFENGTIWQHRVYVKCNTERRIFRGGISAKIRLGWSWPMLDKFEERSAMIGG